MMRCKNKSWRGSKDWWQTSMTLGYRSWFQDLTNVWRVPATMLRNKIMYRQFIHSIAFVLANLKCCTCLIPLYLYFPDTPRTRISKYNSPNIYGSKKWRIKSPGMCVDWCIVAHAFEGCKCEPIWRTTSVTIYQSTWCSIPELESSTALQRGASFWRSKKHFLQVVWKQPFHCPSFSSPTVFEMIELKEAHAPEVLRLVFCSTWASRWSDCVLGPSLWMPPLLYRRSLP